MGKDGLVEIVVISGFYQMFAAINQGFDIVPSGKAHRLRRPERLAWRAGNALKVSY